MKRIYASLFYFLYALTFFTSCSYLEGKEKHKDFIVFTPPKCGTHLIGKALQLMLNEEPMYCLTDMGTLEQSLQLVQIAKQQNQFIIAHNLTSELIKELIKKGYRIIFILRDPRDQVVSMMHFMRKGNWSNFQVAHIENPSDQLDELITGTQYGIRCYDYCIKNRLARILPLPPETVFITRFENLVGPKGGGDHEAQIKELMKIAKFIKFKLTLENAEAVGDHLFGGTWSFHEGQIGSWKKIFLPYHKELYKKIYGNILIKLDYEKDLNW